MMLIPKLAIPRMAQAGGGQGIPSHLLGTHLGIVNYLRGICYGLLQAAFGQIHLRLGLLQ